MGIEYVAISQTEYFRIRVFGTYGFGTVVLMAWESGRAPHALRLLRRVLAASLPPSQVDQSHCVGAAVPAPSGVSGYFVFLLYTGTCKRLMWSHRQPTTTVIATNGPPPPRGTFRTNGMAAVRSP